MAQEVFHSLFTPLNVALLVLLCTVLYLRFRPTAPVELPEGPAATVFRTFTPRTLLPNNGENNGPVYLAVKGKVYDVSSGRNFYGPGGMYENFAGRDATRGLACQSFDEEMLTKDLDGPLDTCEDLTGEQRENLQGWVERFDEKVSCDAGCSCGDIGARLTRVYSTLLLGNLWHSIR
jgi:membrane-associated progesterone receptor component